MYYWAEIFREDKEGKPSLAGQMRFFLTQDSWKRSTKNVKLFWPRSLERNCLRPFLSLWHPSYPSQLIIRSVGTGCMLIMTKLSKNGLGRKAFEVGQDACPEGTEGSSWMRSAWSRMLPLLASSGLASRHALAVWPKTATLSRSASSA